MDVNNSGRALHRGASGHGRAPDCFAARFAGNSGAVAIARIGCVACAGIVITGFAVADAANNSMALATTSPFTRSNGSNSARLANHFGIGGSLAAVCPQFSNGNFAMGGNGLTSALALRTGIPRAAGLRLNLVTGRLPSSATRCRTQFGNSLASPTTSCGSSIAACGR